jgi:hypothetical protein
MVAARGWAVRDARICVGGEFIEETARRKVGVEKGGEVEVVVMGRKVGRAVVPRGYSVPRHGRGGRFSNKFEEFYSSPYASMHCQRVLDRIQVFLQGSRLREGI